MNIVDASDLMESFEFGPPSRKYPYRMQWQKPAVSEGLLKTLMFSVWSDYINSRLVGLNMLQHWKTKVSKEIFYDTVYFVGDTLESLKICLDLLK